MIRSSVTFSMVPEARGGPFVFWDDLPEACERAAKIGFDGMEIFPPGPEAIDVKKIGRLLADHGLALAAVGTGAGWVKHRLHLCQPGDAQRRQAKAFIRSIIDVAGALGAPAIIGSMQGRCGDGVDQATAIGYLAEALEELALHAQGFRVPLLFEPLNRYETNLVTSTEAGLTLLGRLATQNVRLLADLFHMNIEEADLAQALCQGGAKIGHIHFVDSNRRPAGYGHIHFGPIATALRAIGYAGYLSAEALAYPDSLSAAQQTMAAFHKFFRTA